MRQQTARKVIGEGREIEPTLVGFIFKQVFLTVADAHVHVQAITRAIAKGLGHERANQSHLGRDLGRAHFEEGVMIARRQCIGVGVVDLELTIGIFMIDLINIDTHCAQRLCQSLQKRA